MSWTPPDHWSETQSILKKSGTTTLNANGAGVIYFNTDSARQRWVINSIIVKTSQAFNAGTVPTVTIALNSNDVTTMSQGNQLGSTWSGNQDTYEGEIDLSSGDFLSILFAPPTGQPGTSMAGVNCTAVLTGVKYSRRA